MIKTPQKRTSAVITLEEKIKNENVMLATELFLTANCPEINLEKRNEKKLSQKRHEINHK